MSTGTSARLEPPSHWVSSEQKGNPALRPKYKLRCRLLLLSSSD